MWLNDTAYVAKVSEELNRKCRPRNNFQSLYIDPKRHNAQHDRQTDRRQYNVNSRSLLWGKNGGERKTFKEQCFYYERLISKPRCGAVKCSRVVYADRMYSNLIFSVTL